MTTTNKQPSVGGIEFTTTKTTRLNSNTFLNACNKAAKVVKEYAKALNKYQEENIRKKTRNANPLIYRPFKN